MEPHIGLLGHDWYWCGRLPTVASLWDGFTAAERIHSGAAATGPIHRCVAGLVVAHHRAALDPRAPDDADAARLDAEIGRLRDALDDVVAGLLDPPRDGARVHPESYATVVERLAGLYAAAWPASGRWGTAPARVALGRECARYTDLVLDVAFGRACFPQPG